MLKKKTGKGNNDVNEQYYPHTLITDHVLSV